ncbi:SCO family protein [Microbispora sp. RL4-1S]|uniref:SCO family protein n=1 Tax=Microbispora oryzae TaxID=2806554 RepID=A0A941AL11_9ACTN|nr:SCO family protein [Microbispora oryzae]MBP2707696.1 SCO family protein [Microbispora oryzae]
MTLHPFTTPESRRRPAVRAGLALLLLAGALAGCAGPQDGRTGAGTGGAPVRVLSTAREFHGTWLRQPLPEPDVTLTGTSGRPFDLREGTAGRLTLVYFGYTHCPDICPTTMADLASALRELSGAERAKISVVFVTTDPRRDTPAVIRSWLASFDSSFVGLTGDYATIRAAARTAGIALEPPTSTSGDYEVTHGAQVIAYDAAHQGRLIFSSGTPSADYVADLRELLRRGAATAAGARGAAS